MADRDDTASASWGPRHTAGLVGHEAAEQEFLQAWKSGRMAHAWLITGPKGVGKASFAFRCARFVLHSQTAGSAAASGLLLPEMAPAPADSLAVDPADPLFHRVASLGHADLLCLEPAWDEKGKRWRTEIVAEDARRLTPFFGMTAAEGGYRIAIIDSADDLNRHAANAILKILEEPPPKGLIFLVSHSPGALLPTIRSRCRRLALQPLPAERMAEFLSSRVAEEGLPQSEQAALAALAAGSPGRLEALLRNDGLALYDDLLALLATLPDLDIPALQALGDRMGRQAAPDAFSNLLDLLGAILARQIAAAARGRPADAPRPAEAALARRLFPPGNDLADWMAVWEKLGELGRSTDALALDRKHVLLSLFNSLAAAAQRVTRAA